MTNSKLVRLIGVAVVVIAVASLLIVFAPRLAHHCDNCDTFFIGTGYYANDLSNAVSSITGHDNKLLCEECAMQEHAIAIGFGKSLDEYKRPLFED